MSQYYYSYRALFEMLCRIVQKIGAVHVNILSKRLHINSSSVSKMVNDIRNNDDITPKLNTFIQQTHESRIYDEHLITRHESFNRLICFINHSQDELEQIEYIEHTIDTRNH